MRKGRRSRRTWLWAGLLIAAASATAAFGQANIVKDGGFEEPSFSGGYATVSAPSTFGYWTVRSGTIDRLSEPRWQSKTGGRSVDLNGCSPGIIYQDVTTTRNTDYKVSYAIAGNPEGDRGPKVMSIRWEGIEVARTPFDTTGRTNTAMGWQQRSFTVRALHRQVSVPSKSRLEFASLSPGCYGPAVDAVSVSAGSGGADDPPPPVAGKSVVADVVSGVVFIQLPSGKKIRRAKGSSSIAHSAKFRRYKGKANIPVGSKIDTRKGRIAITSAADLKGGVQTGDFYDGIFQVKQARAAKPVTDALLITSRAKCGKGSAHASATKRKLGRLWATAKGKFRTRGRYSAASVRGTTWLTEDRCDGTFTKVSRGRVAVRDNRLRKTILLTAGQSYFARAQRASSR